MGVCSGQSEMGNNETEFRMCGRVGAIVDGRTRTDSDGHVGTVCRGNIGQWICQVLVIEDECVDLNVRARDVNRGVTALVVA